jgi:NAD(P)-dependent dehydrogenase (short-subunit alcohol dehydrogenase family)
MAADGFDAAAQVAVVTGGGSGIGPALCGALTQSGIRSVVAADRNLEAARRVASAIKGTYSHSPALALELDVVESRSVEALVEKVETEIGPIDLWCSNAGLHAGDGLGETTDWRRLLDVNAARAVIPRMVEHRNGHFVVTASAAGLLTDFRCVPYAASKHAAVALAEWLSITYADDGVSVSCVRPEGVRTRMTKPDSLTAGVSRNFLATENVTREIIEAV